ncbi:hypothetical protein GQ457_09G009470 [Hibiscus cannabinus]
MNIPPFVFVRFVYRPSSCPSHHGRGMGEFGHGRVASLTRIGNRLVKPATVMEGSATLVQVALEGDKGKRNFYDVNLVDSYNSTTFQFRSPHGLFHSYAPSEATRKT